MRTSSHFVLFSIKYKQTNKNKQKTTKTLGHPKVLSIQKKKKKWNCSTPPKKERNMYILIHINLLSCSSGCILHLPWDPVAEFGVSLPNYIDVKVCKRFREYSHYKSNKYPTNQSYLCSWISFGVWEHETPFLWWWAAQTFAFVCSFRFVCCVCLPPKKC